MRKHHSQTQERDLKPSRGEHDFSQASLLPFSGELNLPDPSSKDLTEEEPFGTGTASTSDEGSRDHGLHLAAQLKTEDSKQLFAPKPSFRQIKVQRTMTDLKKFDNLWTFWNADQPDTSFEVDTKAVFDRNEEVTLPLVQRLHTALNEKGKSDTEDISEDVPSSGCAAPLSSSGVPNKAWIFWKGDGKVFFPEGVWESVESLNDAVDRYIVGCSSIVRNVTKKTLSNSLRYLLLFTRLLCTLRYKEPAVSEPQLLLIENAVQEVQRLTTTEMVNSSFMPVTDPVELFKLRNRIAEALVRWQREKIDPKLAAFYSGVAGHLSTSELQKFCFHELQPFIEIALRIWSVPTRIQVTQNLLLPSSSRLDRGPFVARLVVTSSGFRIVICNDKVAAGKEHVSLTVPPTLAQYLLFLIKHGRARPESDHVFQAENGGFWSRASRDLRRFVTDKLGLAMEHLFRNSMVIHGFRNIAIATCAVMYNFDLHRLRNLAHLMRHQMETLQHVYSPWLSMRIGESADTDFQDTFGTGPLPAEMEERKEAEQTVRNSCVKLPICTISHVRFQLGREMRQYYLEHHGAVKPDDQSRDGRFFAFGVQDAAVQTDFCPLFTSSQGPQSPDIGEGVPDKTLVAAPRAPTSSSPEKKEAEEDVVRPVIVQPMKSIGLNVPRIPSCAVCGSPLALFGPHGTKRERHWYGRMYLHCNAGSCSTLPRPSKAGSVWYEIGHIPVGAVTLSQKPRNLNDIEEYVQSHLPLGRRPTKIFEDSLFGHPASNPGRSSSVSGGRNRRKREEIMVEGEREKKKMNTGQWNNGAKALDPNTEESDGEGERTQINQISSPPLFEYSQVRFLETDLDMSVPLSDF